MQSRLVRKGSNRWSSCPTIQDPRSTVHLLHATSKTSAHLSVYSTIIPKFTIFTANENLSIACQLFYDPLISALSHFLKQIFEISSSKGLYSSTFFLTLSRQPSLQIHIKNTDHSPQKCIFQLPIPHLSIYLFPLPVKEEEMFLLYSMHSI